MLGRMLCEVVSAEKQLYSGEVQMFIATAVCGDIGIAFGHAPLLTQLVPGPLRLIKRGGQEEVFYVSGGILEVQPRMIIVLADSGIRADELELAQAEQAKADALHAVKNQRADMDYAMAASRLAEASAQLRAIRQLRNRAGR